MKFKTNASMGDKKTDDWWQSFILTADVTVHRMFGAFQKLLIRTAATGWNKEV